MLERYYIKPSTVERILSTWLAPQIENYVQWMESHGYVARNVFRRVPILCRFGEFATQHGADSLDAASTKIEEFAAEWLSTHPTDSTKLGARERILEDARNPVRQMLRLALDGHVAMSRRLKPFHSGPRLLDFFAT